MNKTYHTIVLGLGAMGSAALYQLAKRGQRVLGIDQFHPPHMMGSTHGGTRVTRQAVGEGDHYVPLVMRSYELWREMEAETQAELLCLCGCLLIGPEHGGMGLHGSPDFINQTIGVAERHGIDYELLDPAMMRNRFPQYNLQPHEIAYFEREGGVLNPEHCVQTQLELAQKHGASLQMNEKVLGFEERGQGLIEVQTSEGIYLAEKLVLSAGAWVNEFLKMPQVEPLGIYRQIFAWFEVEEPDLFGPKHFPTALWMGDSMADYFGLFPTAWGMKEGIKLVTEQFDVQCDPNTVERTITAEEIDHIADHFVRRKLYKVNSNCLKSVSCMYTMTPDTDFLLDFHPELSQVIVASPCSGHGFKHSAAIGEALAELAIDGKSRFDLSGFSFDRLLAKKG